MMPFRYCFATSLVLFALFANFAQAAPQNGSSDSALARAMDGVAIHVDRILGELDRSKQVVVGNFVSSDEMMSSGGIEIGRQLAQSLEQADVSVSDGGQGWTKLSGSFKVIEKKELENDDFNSLAVDVTVEFHDENGRALTINQNRAIDEQPLSEMGVPIFGEKMLTVAGVSFDISPTDDDGEKAGKIIQQFHKPATQVKGSKLHSKGPFAVEILVNEDGRLNSRAPVLKSEKAFVELNKSEEYVVKVHNNADFDIAVSMSVDGVNIFVDSQDLSKLSRYLVPAHGSTLIKGWYFHRGNKEVFDAHHKPLPTTKAFLVSGYEDSVAQRTGLKSALNIGTISLDVRAAWPADGDRPSDEPDGDARSVATSQGRSIDQKYKVRKQIVFSPHTRAILHLRYSK